MSGQRRRPRWLMLQFLLRELYQQLVQADVCDFVLLASRHTKLRLWREIDPLLKNTDYGIVASYRHYLKDC